MSDTKYLVTGDVDYVQGHLRYGHFELELTEEEYEEFKLLDEEAQKEWVKNEGELLIDDWEVDDTGDITDVRVEMS